MLEEEDRYRRTGRSLIQEAQILWAELLISEECGVQLSGGEPCVVILAEEGIEVSVNNHTAFTLPKSYLAAFACNNNIVELSTLDHVLVIHINRSIINDYLLFLSKNLTCTKPWSRLATPVITCHSRTPEVFRLATNHSKQQSSKPCEAKLARALLFIVLSSSLEQPRFIALLMYILRDSVRDSVCRIIQSDIQHYWNLRIVASSPCLSPSLLKRRLENENTSYSQIATECRMHYTVQMLLMDNKNVTQVAQLCGYSSTSYFISVFEAFHGLTPLNYLARQRQKVMW